MRNLFLVILFFLSVMSPTGTFANATRTEMYPVFEQSGVVNICCTLLNPFEEKSVDLIFVYDRINEEKAYIFLIDEVDGFDRSIEDYMLVFNLAEGPQVFPMQWDELEDDGKALFCQLRKADLMAFLFEIEKTNNRTLGIALRAESREDQTWIMLPDKLPDTVNH